MLEKNLGSRSIHGSDAKPYQLEKAFSTKGDLNRTKIEHGATIFLHD